MVKSTSEKIWDVVLKASVPLSLLLGSALITHEVRLSKIEATHFTREDSYKLRAALHKEIEERYPPKWLRQKVQHIEQVLDRIEHRIHELEKAR